MYPPPGAETARAPSLRRVDEAAEAEQIRDIPDSLWERITAEPDRAPEYIALFAAERFGPQAERWAREQRRSRSPEKLAKIAVKRHVRLARVEGGVLGLGGAFTAAADLVALTWLQSRMVFFVAAAYEFDPNHPMRPAELLALHGLYDTPAQAREALDGMGTRMAQALVERGLRGKNEAVTTRLIKFAGKRIAKRYAGRLIPVIAAPIGAIQNAGATKDLGRAALAYYGGGPQAKP